MIQNMPGWFERYKTYSDSSVRYTNMIDGLVRYIKTKIVL